MPTYLVFFEGRRTGIAVSGKDRSEAQSKARKKKRRGGTKVVATRQAKGSELAQLRKGKWSRKGPKGEPAGYNKSKRGYGPKPKGNSSKK